jgi:hypothetical protein
VVKSTDCSSEGPEFKAQQPHGGSQPSILVRLKTVTVYSDIIISKSVKKKKNPSTQKAEAGRFQSSRPDLVYRASSRTARATQRNPVSKNKTNKKKLFKKYKVERKYKYKVERKGRGGTEDADGVKMTKIYYYIPV